MIHYDDGTVTVHHGDCIEVMRTLPDNSVDAVVTDPPYGLEFMGKHWDAPWKGSSDSHAEARTRRGDEMSNESKRPYLAAGVNKYEAGLPFQQWCTEWATEALRVLKPGGHLVAFGGTRTWHRLACAIEDAGFEIRDALAWMYGSGFPKSLDVSKAIDKAAGATREVVGVAHADRYPNGPGGNGFHGGVGRGADGTRDTPQMLTAPATDDARRWQGWGTALKPAYEPIVMARKPLAGTVAATVMEHGTGAINIDATRVGSDGGARRGPEDVDVRGPANAILGAGLDLGNHAPRVPGLGRWPANVVLDADAAAILDAQSGVSRDGVAVNRNKVDGVVRDRGTFHMPSKSGTDVTYGGEGGASRFFYTSKAGRDERPTADGVSHPTVKPLDLMRWLVRLVTPPGGVVLEPFAGSGTTAEACVIEGFGCIAIEMTAEYLPLIVARLSKPIQPTLGADL